MNKTPGPDVFSLYVLPEMFFSTRKHLPDVFSLYVLPNIQRITYRSFPNSSKRLKRRGRSQRHSMMVPTLIPQPVRVQVTQPCPALLIPQTIQSMEFSRPEYWCGQPFSSPGDLPNPGIKPRSPVLQADSLPAEPSGKPKNTGVDSLSLLQQIFLTQEPNQGLLHCQQIFYQLSCQGSPTTTKVTTNKTIISQYH